jgi:hypothetical protein
MFRPGLIQAMRGVKSKTKLYNALYAVLGFLVPLLRRLFPHSVTTTVIVGRALIQVAAVGYSKPHLETRDINQLGSGS